MHAYNADPEMEAFVYLGPQKMEIRFPLTAIKLTLYVYFVCLLPFTVMIPQLFYLYNSNSPGFPELCL